MAVDMELNEDRYVRLLSMLVREGKYLQNSPPSLVPQEDRYVNKTVIHFNSPLLKLNVAQAGISSKALDYLSLRLS